MASSLPFRPGAPSNGKSPLARFLPPYLSGAAANWLKDHASPGSWVLEPFGTSPFLPLEIARAGYRVLVAANNPIIRFLLETAANPPSLAAFQSALAHLADSRIGEERLEPHLLSLYNTPCDHCAGMVSAEEFVWQREAETPFARIYTCPHCSNAGQYPATEFDARQAKKSSATRLHIARALARVVPPGDPDRRYVEEAISYYPPRAVYALFSLINKLDTLGENDRRLVSILLLAALDRTNTLWPHPSGRPRPKKLTIPPNYYERNVFRELENAVQDWGHLPSQPVEITRYPDQPTGPAGICLYEGRIRRLAGLLDPLETRAVVAAIPRPNQAFWTLSALWAGWLWGAQAVEHFKPVLRRQRYDWRWHTTALNAALAHLSEGLARPVPFLALMPEAESSFINAFVTAAKTAGFVTVRPAIRHHTGHAQLELAEDPGQAGSALSPENITAAAHHVLVERGEPAPFSALVSAIAAGNDLGAALSPEMRPAELHTQLMDWSEQALTYRAGFLRYKAGKEMDVGLWWLRDSDPQAVPLADRVETAVREHLLLHPGITFADLDTAICRAFPGLVTPEEDIVLACLYAYGVQNEGGGWSLRLEDDPGHRTSERDGIRQMLVRMGHRLGFDVEPGDPLAWSDSAGLYRFFVTETGSLGNIAFTHSPRPGNAFIVVPGSRANLILHKRRSDPRLDYALQEWDFIKFRALRHIADNPAATRQNLDEQLLLDDFRYETLQIRML